VTLTRAIPQPCVRIPVSHATPDGQKLKQVALLIESSGSYGRGLLQGIAKYNRDHSKWSIYFRPHGLGDATPAWLRTWKGDGMLVRLETPEMVAAARRCGIPVVNLRGTLSKVRFPFVTIDHAEVAALAFQHLRERALRHFAFCGRAGVSNPALHERGEYFRALIEQTGAQCHIYPLDGRRTTLAWDCEQQRLAEWIRSLPKPVGIMACNDERGLQVLDACRRAGVAVPDEVAVVGVDDDPAICDLAIPPLSSVDVNAETVGYEAAALLDRMMDGGDAPDAPIKVAPRGVVARASTDLVASEDREVGQALWYIREQACTGLHVGDVLRHMAMSRASLQHRMKQVTGRTIHQEIQRVRLERVKDLLAMTDKTIKQVARESGFASVQYMTRVFRATTTETPARYRLRRTM
jgi:LacI family transcriptional regulator